MRESKGDIGFQNSNPNVRSLLGAPEMLNGLRGYKKALPKKCFDLPKTPSSLTKGNEDTIPFKILGFNSRPSGNHHWHLGFIQ